MIWSGIQQRINKGERLLAVLVDPEQGDDFTHQSVGASASSAEVDLILVGGSTVNQDISRCIRAVKSKCSLPVIIFPGGANQVSKEADAILFLSLASGRNPDYLIGHQVIAAPEIRRLGLEPIGTGYILIDSGKETAVERVSGTRPIKQDDISLIVATAMACEMLGMQAVYLEAGSGAEQPVPASVIKAVRSQLTIPIVVGGGLRTQQDLDQAYIAGANIAVVGTLIEESIDNLSLIQKSSNTC